MIIYDPNNNTVEYEDEGKDAMKMNDIRILKMALSIMSGRVQDTTAYFENEWAMFFYVDDDIREYWDASGLTLNDLKRQAEVVVFNFMQSQENGLRLLFEDRV